MKYLISIHSTSRTEDVVHKHYFSYDLLSFRLAVLFIFIVIFVHYNMALFEHHNLYSVNGSLLNL